MDSWPYRDGWCVLRTAGASTLRLAKSLNDAGIEAWTPGKMVALRVGKSRRRSEYPAPILPTFVFAKSAHIGELQRLRRLTMTQHPGFSVFRHLGLIPVIAERDMTSLRSAEERANRAAMQRKRNAALVGSMVTSTEGPWAGMTGIVESSTGKAAVVNFGGNHTVTISAWLLPDDQVCDAASGKDVAARAA